MEFQSLIGELLGTPEFNPSFQTVFMRLLQALYTTVVLLQLKELKFEVLII